MPIATMAPTTSAENSTDITVTAGTPINIGLYTDAGGALGYNDLASAPITRKNPNGTYTGTGVSLSPQSPNQVINGPGVYRVEKPATVLAIGIVTD